MKSQTIADGFEAAETAAQELSEILILLALGSAVIASPGTPPLLARVIAVMMQHAATAWADLLATTEDFSVVKGGEV